MATEYAQKHKMGATIEAAITEALGKQPENPFEALAAWFQAGGVATVTEKKKEKKMDAARYPPKSFPIGSPGKPWGDAEKKKWRATRKVQRSYKEQVLDKLEQLDSEIYSVEQYGALEQDKARYPLFAVKLKGWQDGRPHVLVTGGVHGYEMSGVQGAILFLKEAAQKYAEKFNIVVIPCVSPWGYETIQRWNCDAVDPNRSFNPDGEVLAGRAFHPEPSTDEARNVIAYLKQLGVSSWCAHVDLHETTDTDETEFRPAKAARDGDEFTPGTIPDGFYLVGDETNLQAEWHAAMIAAVKEVTHIAPAGDDGKIIGEDVLQEGVIAVPKPSDLGLCSGVTNAEFAATTEVYPDSPSSSDEQCNRAQVACLAGGLDHIIKARGL